MVVVKRRILVQVHGSGVVAVNAPAFNRIQMLLLLLLLLLLNGRFLGRLLFRRLVSYVRLDSSFK
jgi:hypothetical protein